MRMPSCSAASMTVVPSSAEIATPSTIKLIFRFAMASLDLRDG